MDLLGLRGGRFHASADINFNVVGGICHVGIHCGGCGVVVGANGRGLRGVGFVWRSGAPDLVYQSETRHSGRDHVKLTSMDRNVDQLCVICEGNRRLKKINL